MNQDQVVMISITNKQNRWQQRDLLLDHPLRELIKRQHNFSLVVM